MFHALWTSRFETFEEWTRLQEAAESSRAVERLSCISIQRLFRGQRVRAWISRMRAACVEIERVFRGHVGRVSAGAVNEAWAKHEEAAVFHYFATDCQRTFRGFYSRRYRHDFAARRAYIESVVKTGNDLRVRLEKQLVQQQITEREADEQGKREQFTKITQQLHHLVSTKSIPGVYNSPYDVDSPICAMGGVPIEEHLCSGVKDLLRLSQYAKPNLTTDLNGMRRNALEYRADKRQSLQQSSPYDAPLEAARMEAKLGKVGFMGAADLRFVTDRCILITTQVWPAGALPSVPAGDQ